MEKLTSALQVLIVAAFAALVMAQVVLLPSVARDSVVADPGFAWVRAPLLTVSILVVACAQIVLVATWRLLSVVGWDTVLTPDAYPWVDAVIVALIAATALCGSATIWLVGAGAGHPGTLLPLLTTGACSGAGAMLMRVMKALLVRATEQRVELARVV